jgi:hypothetical protein
MLDGQKAHGDIWAREPIGLLLFYGASFTAPMVLAKARAL